MLSYSRYSSAMLCLLVYYMSGIAFGRANNLSWIIVDDGNRGIFMN